MLVIDVATLYTMYHLVELKVCPLHSLVDIECHSMQIEQA